MKPGPDEWDLSNLCTKRRGLLENGKSFEEISKLIVGNVGVIEPRFETYDARPHGVSKDTKQVCFKLHVEPELCDLFYNSPDGLRGRYWQSPDLGYVATRKLICSLKEKLFQSCSAKLEGFDHDFIQASLDGVSAKVWIYEKRKTGASIVTAQCSPQLRVKRWEDNEQFAEVNKGLWRCVPIAEFVEIKGGLIDPDFEEHIPMFKRDRSCQIHRFGYT